MLAAFFVGCAAQRRAPSTGVAVRSVHFEGNGGALSGRSDLNLRSGMEQSSNPTLVWLLKPRQRRVFLDEETLALDAWRLEVWYAHRGYFDARFDGWQIRWVRPKRGRGLLWKPPRAVRIVGHVEEGAPYTVSKLEWRGMESLGGPAIARVRNAAALSEGDVFSLSALNTTVDGTRAFLLDKSYAYVEVEPRVDVYPSPNRTVEVVIDVRLGPSCTFGDVRLSGLDEVPEDLVRAELPIQPPEEGQRPQAFGSSELGATRRRMFGLGVFSVVNVLPELEQPPSDPTAREEWAPGTVIPVNIDVVEGSFKQMRLGGGFLFEGGRQEVHVSSDFSHVNLFSRLINLDWRNALGYAAWFTQDELLTTDIDLPETRGPIVDSELELSFPQFPARGWRLSTDLRYELGVEQGYRFSSPSTSPSLRWRATDRIDLEFGYHLRFFDYLDFELDEGRYLNTPLGLDISDPYLLSYLRQKVVFSSQDDLLFPRRGLYAEYELAEAGGPVGGQFDFVRFKADQRAYIPIIRLFGWRPQGAIGLRLGGGAIFPWGDAGVPTAERLYLGGANDVRGWQSNRLGPYVCDPTEGRSCVSAPGRTRPVRQAVNLETAQLEPEVDRRGRPVYADVIPVGGLLSLFTSVEVRLYTISDLGIALFSDAGMSWGRYPDAWPPIILPSVGGGLRYKLDFGALRLDIARRLTDPAMFVGEPYWNFHFGLSEAF